MKKAALCCFAAGLACAYPASAAISQQPDGLVLGINGNNLKIVVRADNVIHVAYAKDPAFFTRESFDVLPSSSSPPAFSIDQRDGVTLSTTQLRVHVDTATGAITFADASGKQILVEKPGSRVIEAAQVQGEQTSHVAQQWLAATDESLYGLGQQQFGILDIKGYDLDLWQHNTNVVVPFLVSSRGYGILWDNASYTRFGDVRPFEQIPAANLVDASGMPGGLTRGTFTPATPDQLANPQSTGLIAAGGTRGVINLPSGGTIQTSITPPTGRGRGRGGFGAGPIYTRWSGEIIAPTTGDYQFQTYSNGGVMVSFDNKTVINHWRQNWLASSDVFKVHLEAGKHYPIKVESGGDQANTFCLLWKTPSASSDTSLWSEVGDGVDYYFVYGPSIEKVIAGYRLLTGQASMMPQWAFGLWQSRQKYNTAQESLDVVNGFRSRSIPFDNIVQDWQYWPENAWGSQLFDPNRFPDPEGWVKAIHDLHAHLMISVWGKYYSGDYQGNENFQAMQQAGFLYKPTLDEGIRDWVGRGGYNFAFYDAFNPGARKEFWAEISSAIFSKGIDAWWMDATEPDVVQPSPPTLETMRHFIEKTFLGTASRVMNAYPLENSRAVYEGQRSVKPDQRVFILTRSGYAGEQRYATATWSGDITSTWTAMAKQIPAGLGFSISGIPYWTMDCGGYTMDSRFSSRNQTPEAADEWRELNARWFEFCTFIPLLRVHGELQPREMWNIGDESTDVYKAELKFDRLRYRLLPYIYSVAGAVTQQGTTFMRPLVMDFPGDAKARELANEYLFGPAFLVTPVTAYKARTWPVYLPEGATWYDFWTGTAQKGGQTLEAPAPYDQTPLYVRAGSIIPFGPELQYTGEKPADPITLYVYTGADGDFTLYEDDGLTYNYEKGAFAQIPIHWNDSTQTLTLGKRTGSFDGMLKERTFNVVFVSPGKPVGFTFDAKPTGSLTVRYSGDSVATKLPVATP